MHVMTHVRGAQNRHRCDDKRKRAADALAATAVVEVIELLNTHGFVVAKEVEEPKDVAAAQNEIADLVLAKWVAASSSERDMVRNAIPALGLALDRLQVGPDLDE